MAGQTKTEFKTETPRPQRKIGSQSAPAAAQWKSIPAPLNGHPHSASIDRTAKLFIGGAQKRPDGNYTRPIFNPAGEEVGQAADGNRKDIRDAVEAARKAEGWGLKPGHTRAQILYYLAENLNARSDEFARRLVSMTGAKLKDAQAEVEAALDRLFTYAAYCDKYGGEIKETTLRGIVMGLHEPVGVIGIACPDDAPLLASSRWSLRRLRAATPSSSFPRSASR